MQGILATQVPTEDVSHVFDFKVAASNANPLMKEWNANPSKGVLDSLSDVVVHWFAEDRRWLDKLLENDLPITLDQMNAIQTLLTLVSDEKVKSGERLSGYLHENWNRLVDMLDTICRPTNDSTGEHLLKLSLYCLKKCIYASNRKPLLFPLSSDRILIILGTVDGLIGRETGTRMPWVVAKSCLSLTITEKHGTYFTMWLLKGLSLLVEKSNDNNITGVLDFLDASASRFFQRDFTPKIHKRVVEYNIVRKFLQLSNHVVVEKIATTQQLGSIVFKNVWAELKSLGWYYLKGTGLVSFYYVSQTISQDDFHRLLKCASLVEGQDYFISEDSLLQWYKDNLLPAAQINFGANTPLHKIKEKSMIKKDNQLIRKWSLVSMFSPMTAPTSAQIPEMVQLFNSAIRARHDAKSSAVSKDYLRCRYFILSYGSQNLVSDGSRVLPRIRYLLDQFISNLEDIVEHADAISVWSFIACLLKEEHWDDFEIWQLMVQTLLTINIRKQDCRTWVTDFFFVRRLEIGHESFVREMLPKLLRSESVIGVSRIPRSKYFFQLVMGKLDWISGKLRWIGHDDDSKEKINAFVLKYDANLVKIEDVLLMLSKLGSQITLISLPTLKQLFSGINVAHLKILMNILRSHNPHILSDLVNFLVSSENKDANDASKIQILKDHKELIEFIQPQVLLRIVVSTPDAVTKLMISSYPDMSALLKSLSQQFSDSDQETFWNTAGLEMQFMYRSLNSDSAKARMGDRIGKCPIDSLVDILASDAVSMKTLEASIKHKFKKDPTALDALFQKNGNCFIKLIECMKNKSKSKRSRIPCELKYPYWELESARASVHSLSEEAIETLQENRHLNDAIVMFYSRHVIWNLTYGTLENDIRIFEATLVSNLFQVYTDTNASQQAFDRFQNSFPAPPYEQKVFCFPIVDSQHWSLLLLFGVDLLEESPTKSKKECKFLFLDSYSYHKGEEYAQLVWSVISKKLQVRAPHDIKSRELSFEQLKVPQQQNTCDCGVFVCRYIDTILNHFVRTGDYNWEGVKNLFNTAYTHGAINRHHISSLIQREISHMTKYEGSGTCKLVLSIFNLTDQKQKMWRLLFDLNMWAEVPAESLLRVFTKENMNFLPEIEDLFVENLLGSDLSSICINALHLLPLFAQFDNMALTSLADAILSTIQSRRRQVNNENIFVVKLCLLKCRCNFEMIVDHISDEADLLYDNHIPDEPDLQWENEPYESANTRIVRRLTTNLVNFDEALANGEPIEQHSLEFLRTIGEFINTNY